MYRSSHSFVLLAASVVLAICPCFAPGSFGQEAEESESLPLAKSLPFPPDAREMEFDATFDDVEFTSGSSMASLAAFYRDKMQERGWAEDAAAATVDEDSLEMTFKQREAEVVIELDQQSDGTVDVSMDCEEVDFTGTDDPAALVAAGVPQPRAYLFLQKEIPRPDSVQDQQYRSDACHFKSTLALQAAFDHHLQALRSRGWQETRRPIITDDRRYTEFKRGPVSVSVNIFSHEVGSRIILTYEDDRKEPVVPPLAAVASTAPGVPGITEQPNRNEDAAPDGSPQLEKREAPAKVVVDVSKNAGAATITFGAKKYVFKNVAAYASTSTGDERTYVVFADKPIPLQRMQAMLAADNDFSFGDLYEFDLPRYVEIQLGEYPGFSFSADGTGIGHGIDDPESDLTFEGGRVRGTFQMREAEEIFDKPFLLSVTVDAAILTPNTRVGGVPDAPAVAASQSPFADSHSLLPEGSDDVQSEGSRYLKSTKATVDSELPAIVEFYRRELGTQGWTEDGAGRSGLAAGDASATATLVFRGVAGTMTIKLQSAGRQSQIELTSRDEAKARQDGMLPEPGKGRLVLGNAHSRGVVITIGRQDYPLRAGQGARDPKTALNYTVAPGAYVLMIKIPGESPQTERLEIAAGTTWGVITLPTGGYLAQRLY